MSPEINCKLLDINEDPVLNVAHSPGHSSHFTATLLCHPPERATAIPGTRSRVTLQTLSGHRYHQSQRKSFNRVFPKCNPFIYFCR